MLNAYAVAAIPGVDALSATLEERGLRVPVYLVHSAGGVLTAPEARYAPITLARSGPAAGVAACVTVAKAARRQNVVACDMGGTSFDVAVITEQRAPALHAHGDRRSAHLAADGRDRVHRRGRWIDRVGRRARHAAGRAAIRGGHPGPACYGRGGTAPTVTDALLVLGFLDPKRFLGGDMTLDVEAARQACARLGEQLGLDAEECAWGIRRLALEGMATAVRSRLSARASAADFTLASFGGCGALFTADLAAMLGIARGTRPRAVFGAVGLRGGDGRTAA